MKKKCIIVSYCFIILFLSVEILYFVIPLNEQSIIDLSLQDRVKKLLLMLASAEDVSLQLLSVRLDFNEYYKSKDSRLVAPLTYQHRRRSEHFAAPK